MAKITAHFEKLTSRLQKHVWCAIFFMGLLIFWLAAFIYDGKGSDWASWLSILLAVIVVVYMFLQTHRSEQNLSEMRHLISEGQQLMTEKAGVLAEKAVSIEGSMALIHSLVQSPTQDIAPQEPLKKTKFELNISGMSNYALLVMYSLVKAQNQKKPLPVRLLAFIERSERQHERIFDIAYGVAFGIARGFQCFLEAVIWSEGWELKVKTLPAGVESHISSHITTQRESSLSAEAYFERNIKQIDAYFEEGNNSQE